MQARGQRKEGVDDHEGLMIGAGCGEAQPVTVNEAFLVLVIFLRAIALRCAYTRMWRKMVYGERDPN